MYIHTCSARVPDYGHGESTHIQIPPEMRGGDLFLPYQQTNDSVWLSAYTFERERREQLEQLLLLNEQQSATRIPTTRRKSKSGAITGTDQNQNQNQNQHQNSEKSNGSNGLGRPPDSEVIDNLIRLLRARKVPDTDIRNAILHGELNENPVPVPDEEPYQAPDSPAIEQESEELKSPSPELPVDSMEALSSECTVERVDMVEHSDEPNDAVEDEVSVPGTMYKPEPEVESLVESEPEPESVVASEFVIEQEPVVQVSDNLLMTTIDLGDGDGDTGNMETVTIPESGTESGTEAVLHVDSIVNAEPQSDQSDMSEPIQSDNIDNMTTVDLGMGDMGVSSDSIIIEEELI